MSFRPALRAVLSVGLAFSAQFAFAQDYRFSVLVDLDNRDDTGCTVNLGGGNVVEGIERRLSAQVTAATQIVSNLVVESCAGGVFGAPQTVGTAYPAGLNNGLAGADVVELGASVVQLTGFSYPQPFRLHFAAQSAAGSDLLGSRDGGGGAPIVFGTPPVPLPGLGWLGMGLLAAAILVILRGRRYRPMLRRGTAGLLVLASGIALAANFVVDGLVGDWAGEAPIATDVVGDSTSGQSAIDIVAAFAAFENERLFFRIDLRDLENEAPVADPGAAQTLEDTATTIVLSGSDDQNAPLTFAVASAPGSGSLGAITITSPTTADVTYTPDPDFNGADAFTFTVNDGELDSAPATVSITVTAVNDAPGFTGNDATIYENGGAQSVSVATGISAGPPDEAGQTLTFQITANSNPALFAVAPTIAADGTLTATPAANTLGSASLTVILGDNGGTANGGIDTSPPQTITLTVDDVNDPPTFTPGADPTVLEDAGAQTIANWATAISDGDDGSQTLTFIVQANTNPALFSAVPAISPTGTLTFTSAADANGSADITIVLQDNGGTANGGVDTSAPVTFAINVTAVNDAPSFTLTQPPASLEDVGAQSAAVAGAISAGPPDETGQTLSFSLTPVSSDPTLTFSGAPALAADGTLSYTAAPNAWGVATFDVVLGDNGGTANGGVDASPAQTLTITVTPVNDAPSFTAADPPPSAEDAGAQSVAGWVSAFDPGPNEAGQGVAEYLVSVTANPGLFATAPAVSPAGVLTYTAAADAFGSATIAVQVRDDGGTANGGVDLSTPAQNFTITVTAVNDAPLIDLNGPAPGTGFAASFVEGSVPVAIVDAAQLTVTDIDSATLTSATVVIGNLLDGVDEVLAVNVGGSGLSALYASGVLSVTGVAAPSVYETVLRTTTYANLSSNPNETARQIEFVAQDAEGAITAPPAVATVSVAGINSAPSFTPGTAPIVLEDAGPQTIANWATAISDGDDGSQVLTFIVQANTNPALFSTGPAISPTGTLTFTPAADANGSADITIVLQDDGGTANGGADTSTPPVTFTVTVTAVNDVPSFSVPATATPVLENAGAQTQADFATAISAGPPDEAGQLLTFNVSVTATTSSLAFTTAPTIDASGTLTFTAQNDTSGTATVQVTLSDNGGTANGGIDTSLPQTFTIEVLGVNSAPTFTPGDDVTVLEDSGAYSAVWATAMDDGDLDEVQGLTFIVQNNTNTALFSSEPVIDAVTGVLTFTPAADANGSAAITIVLQDDGGTANGGVDTSGPETFTITVTAVNDAPSFDVPASAPTVLEDAGAQSIAGFATNLSTGPANESTQTLLGFTLTADNPGLFSTQPAIALNGTLTYTAAPNAFGTATITATLQDNGGTDNGGVDSFSRTFTISVTGVNDMPTFTPGANPTVAEDSGAYNQPWATAVSDGDDGSQVLTFNLAGNTNTALFSTQPAISAGGNLSFTPAPNAFGSATISVTLSDNGGTANGGVDTSTPPVNLMITVTPVNDPPVVVPPTNVPVNRHIGILIPPAHASGLLANVSDPADGAGAIPFSTTVQINAPTAAGGRVNVGADGGWNYEPPASASLASDSFNFEVCDSGVPGSACTTATATIALSGTAVWFVNAAAAAGGDGTLARPFQTLAPTITAAGTGGQLFVFSGAYSGGVTLAANQALIGQGVSVASATSFDAVFAITPPSTSVARPTIGGTRPVITTTVAATDAITLGTGNTIRGIEIGNTTGSGLTGTALGTLTLGDNLISGAGQALNLTNGTLAQAPAATAFASITSTSGTNNIALSGIGGTVNLGGGALSGASGTAFAFSTGTANLSYAGTIGKASAGRLIDIDGAGAATLTLSGDLSCTGSCGTGAGNAGIRVNARNGGSYTFSGGSKTISSSAGNPGVSLTANPGATISFNGGGLAVSTAAGTAFNASGGGTVTVTTGTNPNTLSSSAGIALNIGSTTIGAADLTFRSISASGGASGIVLNNTGSAGALLVTGNGGTCSTAVNCTGGAIQNTTSHGISLTSTTEPSFTRMFVNNTAGHGVGGTEVNGVSFTDGVISNSGTDLVPNRANIGFNITALGTERNLYGVVTIIGNTLTNARYHGVEIFNYNGTISSAEISGNTLTSTTSAATSQGAGISFIAYGSNTTVANVTRANISNNVISNFPGGVGLQAQGGNSSAAGPAGVFGVAGSGTDIISITGNRIAGASAGNRIGGEAIVALVGGRGQGNFNISSNGTVANPITNMTGQAISHSAFGMANVTSTISNNVIVANNSFASPGIGGGLGNTFGVGDTPQMTVTVSNNTISQTEGNGILLVSRDTNGTLRARVQNNTVATPTGGVRPGIRIDSGNGGAGENDTVCLNIAGNTSAGSGGTQGIGLRKEGTVPGTFAFGVHGMAATGAPGVQAYVNGLNPAGNGTLLIAAESGFTNCTLP